MLEDHLTFINSTISFAVCNTHLEYVSPSTVRSSCIAKSATLIANKFWAGWSRSFFMLVYRKIWQPRHTMENHVVILNHCIVVCGIWMFKSQEKYEIPMRKLAYAGDIIDHYWTTVPTLSSNDTIKGSPPLAEQTLYFRWKVDWLSNTDLTFVSAFSFPSLWLVAR